MSTPLKPSKAKALSAAARRELLTNLKARFEANVKRHPEIEWAAVAARLESSNRLSSLNEMEASGGEPDVIGRDKKSGEYIFVDCSAQTPAGRRNVCYDRAALEARKAHKPKDSAMDMAGRWGVDILNEDEYLGLQALGEFDTKTSSWISTPDRIRKLGGALFCDRRFDTVFVYHNGAESYYAGRGFRCVLRI
jgi:hypothetical protein